MLTDSRSGLAIAAELPRSSGTSNLGDVIDLGSMGGLPAVTIAVFCAKAPNSPHRPQYALSLVSAATSDLLEGVITHGALEIASSALIVGQRLGSLALANGHQRAARYLGLRVTPLNLFGAYLVHETPGALRVAVGFSAPAWKAYRTGGHPWILL